MNEYFILRCLVVLFCIVETGMCDSDICITTEVPITRLINAWQTANSFVIHIAIKSSETIDAFRKKLKIHLFEIALLHRISVVPCSNNLFAGPVYD